MAWDPPGGKTPPQCLEYEVQLAEDLEEAKAAWAVGMARTVSQGGERGGEPCLMGAARRHAGKLGFTLSCRWGVSYPVHGLCRDIIWC